ncbi:MAG: lysine--tRNA ligase [Sorangiineae bacterium]|nr:lysine--tRNA ligase [Polyangiaceae bacterium]MEB2324574.1 lysine--tRNA ligase [Sorangiineae bacterium]
MSASEQATPADEATSAEDALVEARRAKAERVRARGGNPFANDVALDDRELIAALRQRFASALVDAREGRYAAEQVAALGGEAEVHVIGRLMARRGFGKASFLRLRDGSGELQIFAKQDVLGADYAALDEIDLADHLEVRGPVMVTKTGELSVQATSLRLLTKALRPLPDKWHGLTDVDARYRRRYVDLVANPDAAMVLRARSFVVQGLRSYLDGLGFLEVETPTLHPLVGGAAARPFVTHHNTLDMTLFLRIAPELYLKRLLVGGLERVYEIGRSYRNEGISTRHNPEFTMLEFYQAYATYQTLMTEAEEMLRHVDGFLAEKMASLGQAETHARWVAERPFTFAERFARVPMKDAIGRALELAGLPAGLELSSESLGARASSLAERSPRAAAIDWQNFTKGLAACDSEGERTFSAYEYLAEPFLAEDYRARDGARSVPVFITDYPFEVSPLARKKDADPSLVDRFELFVHSRELCNAFSELNDPDDQAERFRAQVDKKTRGAEETMDYDVDYVRALEHGMPSAAGFGLGVDRLVMMLTAQSSIRDVIAFPLMRPESTPR